MKKIASIIIAMFMGIALAIGGGVLLSGCDKNQQTESNIVISNSYTWTLLTGCTISLNANGGSGGTTEFYSVSVKNFKRVYNGISMPYSDGRYFFNTTGTSSSTSPIVSTITVPTRANYAFLGYFTAASGGTQTIDSTGTVLATAASYTSHTTWYAHWTTGYTVSFSANGGNGTMSNQTWAYGAWYSVQPLFTRTGYTFSGWSISTNSAITHYYGPSTSSYSTTTAATFVDDCSLQRRYYKNLRSSAGTVTFTAQWTINKYTINVARGDVGIYDITNPATSWNYNGGNTVGGGKSNVYEYGTSITISVAVNSGYSFSHWSDGSTVNSRTITVTGNATYTAYTTPNKYMVSFDPNGGVGVNLFSYIPQLGSSTNQLSSNDINYYTSGEDIYVSSKSNDYADHYGHLDIWFYFNANVNYQLSFSAVSTNSSVLNSPVDAGFFLDGGYSLYYHVGGPVVNSTSIPVTFIYNFTPTTSGKYQFRLDTNYNNAKFKLSNFSLTSNGGVSGRMATYNSSYGTLPTPTRANYNFDGWKRDVYLDRNQIFETVNGHFVWLRDVGVNLQEGTRYHLSFDMRLTSGEASWEHDYLFVNYRTTATLHNAGENVLRNATTSWQKYECEFTFANNNGTYDVLYDKDILHIYLNGEPNRQIKNLSIIEENATITSTSTMNLTYNHTLYAKWTPAPVSINVKLRTINMNGSYSDVDNANGGEVEVHWWQISGANSSPTGVVQTTSSGNYSVHSGQQFYLVAHEKSGYVFAGVSTSGAPSEAIKNPSSPPVTTVSYYPTSGTTYYVYFKQMSGNQLKYDETDKYFYFEDGYYPQSDVNAMNLKPLHSSGTTINGVTVTYESNDTVIINGTLSPNSTTPIFYTDAVSYRFKQGTTAVATFTKLSGSASGSGAACWSVEVCKADKSNVSTRNYVDCYNNFAGIKESANFQISSAGASEGVHLRVQIYCSSAFTFNNLRFRMNVAYDRKNDLSGVATATGEKISISQPFPSDMREWERYSMGDSFSSTYNSSNDMNILTINGVDGWEKIGVPVQVERNTNYIWSFTYQESDFTHWGEGLELCVMNEQPNGNGQQSSLAGVWIKASTGSSLKKVEIEFNSGDNTTLFFALNAGQLGDLMTHTFNIGQFKLSGGQFNVDKEFPIYTHNGERFAVITVRGETEWFKFEPIRWRISDYGVAKTERNIQRYTSLYNLRNYTSYASNFVAVSDLILGVGAMHNTRVVDENRKTETGALDGTYSIHMTGFQSVENAVNGCEFNFSYSASQSMIDVERYGYTETGDGNAVFNSADNGWSHPYSSPLRIASIKELEAVGFVNKQARASDMVAFILGLDKNQVSYWTRDLSNLGAGIAITPTGTEIRPWLDEVLGIRFAYNFREGSSIFYG